MSEQRGMLLVEVITGMTIIVILVSGIALMMPTAVKAWQLGRSQAEIQQTARLAIERITQHVRYASNVSLADADDTLVIKDGNDWDIKFTVSPKTKALCISVNGSAEDPLTGNGIGGAEGTIIVVENPDNKKRFDVQEVAMLDKDGKLLYIKLVTVMLTVRDKQTGTAYTMQAAALAFNTSRR
ncbi:PilW family protein [Sporomusa silvacetica]|uniref:PilW family protein n=1 Tax=Sporomusa silvacetica TaxID=55504 RepID=UPI000B99E067|nr:hypothetical protein [Sporomusa silvacetica]